MTSYSIPSDRVKIDRDGDIQYVGVAPSGALDSEPSWRIMRITSSGNDVVSIEWADGDKNSDNIWDDRATKTYS